MIKIRMPKLSPTMETGVLSNWTVKVSDIVKPESVIAEIETDKAIMEVEALDHGTIGYLFDVEKQEIPVNAVIGFILEKGEQAPASWDEYIKQEAASVATKVDAAEPKVSQQKVDVVVENVADIGHKRIFASPLAKMIAKERDVDLSQVQGSGPRGRIVRADVDAHQTNGPVNAKPAIIGAAAQEVPMTNMRKIIAQRLSQAKQEIPHIYMEKKVYINATQTVRENLLKKFEKKISLTPFFIKAVALSLRDNPVLNRTFENGKMIQHFQYNIGIAVAVEGGLYVPVIANADKKSLIEIADELVSYAALAKEGKLRPEHLANGTFSISNLGMYGIDSFCAIVNPPQVGILAISSDNVEPYFNGTEFVPMRAMISTLSCDHRVVDGADGAKFMQSFANYIQNPEGMLL